MKMLNYNWFYTSVLFCLVLVFSTGCNTPKEETTTETQATEQRIISLNGSITECLYRLELGNQLVGRDVTSTYPSEKVAELPNLGHISKLNTEAILSLTPDVILVDAKKANSDQLHPLSEAGIEIVPIELTTTLDNGLKIAQQLAKKLNVSDDELKKLETTILADEVALQKTLAKVDNQARPKVLFIYARGTGRLMVAGAETQAEDMIEMSGGKNAIEDFTNFQALTPEALLAASPDVILMFESGLESLDGKAGLAEIPGMAEVPAFINDRIIAMDGHYLLGFGPRAAKAANELAQKLIAYNTEINTK